MKSWLPAAAVPSWLVGLIKAGAFSLMTPAGLSPVHWGSLGRSAQSPQPQSQHLLPKASCPWTVASGLTRPGPGMLQLTHQPLPPSSRKSPRTAPAPLIRTCSARMWQVATCCLVAASSLLARRPPEQGERSVCPIACTSPPRCVCLSRSPCGPHSGFSDPTAGVQARAPRASPLPSLRFHPAP